MGEFERYLAVGAALFILGALGFLTRRNLILMVLSAEMMLHGVALTLVTFGRMHHSQEGQAFTIFILTVAACEAGLALSLILALYQQSKSLDVELWTNLREPDLPSPRSEAGDIEPEEEEVFPTLTPAGRSLQVRRPSGVPTASNTAPIQPAPDGIDPATRPSKLEQTTAKK
jgi:NADH-quinone oxidoreductase subunit K